MLPTLFFPWHLIYYSHGAVKSPLSRANPTFHHRYIRSKTEPHGDEDGVALKDFFPRISWVLRDCSGDDLEGQKPEESALSIRSRAFMDGAGLFGRIGAAQPAAQDDRLLLPPPRLLPLPLALHLPAGPPRPVLAKPSRRADAEKPAASRARRGATRARAGGALCARRR